MDYSDNKHINAFGRHFDNRSTSRLKRRRFALNPSRTLTPRLGENYLSSVRFGLATPPLMPGDDSVELCRKLTEIDMTLFGGDLPLVVGKEPIFDQILRHRDTGVAFLKSGMLSIAADDNFAPFIDAGSHMIYQHATPALLRREVLSRAELSEADVTFRDPPLAAGKRTDFIQKQQELLFCDLARVEAVVYGARGWARAAMCALQQIEVAKTVALEEPAEHLGSFSNWWHRGIGWPDAVPLLEDQGDDEGYEDAASDWRPMRVVTWRDRNTGAERVFELAGPGTVTVRMGLGSAAAIEQALQLRSGNTIHTPAFETEGTIDLALFEIITLLSAEVDAMADYLLSS